MRPIRRDRVRPSGTMWIRVGLDSNSFANRGLFLLEQAALETSKQEELWVLRAQCDDREALELLLRSVQPSLRRYLCGIVGPTDADDILQETLVIVFRKLVWLEYPELFRPWVFRIASRAAFRHLKRKKQREAHDEAAAPDDFTFDKPPSVEILQQLETNNAISPASRAVLVLHFQEDLSLPEVAEVLEIPLGTVKSRLAYGLATLRKQLARGGERNDPTNGNRSG